MGGEEGYGDCDGDEVEVERTEPRKARAPLVRALGATAYPRR